MAEEKKEQKIIIEREYTVPLRVGWLKVPKYKRAKKALKTLKEFMVKHMKVYDRDLAKIKVDVLLNNEIRFMGMKKPLPYIKVKAIKYENGEVAVKLVNIPKNIEFELARNAKKEAEKLTNQKEKPKAEAKVEEKKESNEEKIDTKEKEESSRLETEQLEKQDAKQAKHTSKISQEEPKIQRKALKR
jgi:large subunit ribosomal protein L31e